MPQFFVPAECISEGRFYISGREAHHLIRVMRGQEGQSIEIFDGKGRKFLARVDRILGPSEISGAVLSEMPSPPPRVDLTLCAALVSRAKFEDMIEKCAEVGVSRIVPLVTERTETRVRLTDRDAKLRRWRAIVLSACKQSGHSRLCTIVPPRNLDDALRDSRSKPALIALPPAGTASLPPAPGEKSLTLREALDRLTKKGTDLFSQNKNRFAQSENRSVPFFLYLFIGPEGGFAPEEFRLAVSFGAVPFSICSHTLRSETAAVVCSSLILYGDK